MKKKLFMSVAIVGALIALPAVSQGAASVWFEGGGGGGEGTVLELSINGGPQTVSVDMIANVTNVGLYSNITTLSADGPVAADSWTAIPPAGGAETPGSGFGVPGPGNIAINFGAATFSGAGYLGPAVNMGTLEISFDDSALGTEISASIGSGLWAESTFTPATVSFAGNASVNGGVAGADGGVVIRIVPEPATLSLLGLGVIALIRRRR